MTWSIICRDMGGVGMDDGPLRQFYAEWSRWLGVAYDTGEGLPALAGEVVS